jgi:hypothetical protein
MQSTYIHNAGLVLLWPFLTRYFEMAGLIKDNKFVNDTAANRGVFLVQYLVSGNAHAEPETLSLNKLLCGLPQEFVTTPVAITEEEMNEGESMLHAVINHWAVIGNTSIDGLRDSFLLREGALAVRDERYELHVAKHAYDILLDHLPYSLSIIKYQWMPQPLHILWR